MADRKDDGDPLTATSRKIFKEKMAEVAQEFDSMETCFLMASKSRELNYRRYRDFRAALAAIVNAPTAATRRSAIATARKLLDEVPRG